MFKYNVQLDKSRDVYVSSVPYRQVECEGATEKDAIGNLIEMVADLAYTGKIDPSDPGRVGCHPIQHVLNVLTDRLTWELDRRQDCAEHHSDDDVVALQQTAARNEVIAGLSTAIAALARVKAL